jgi:hypothetical protein
VTAQHALEVEHLWFKLVAVNVPIPTPSSMVSHASNATIPNILIIQPYPVPVVLTNKSMI